ncbi:MAG TPA: diguanylate cyclase [Candidatus Limnocylindria bacterium]|nr:diguanylate cyclase [Candidatus Limnocylindria bacterium]
MLWLLRLLGFLYPVVAAVCLTLLGAMLVHQPPGTRGYTVGLVGLAIGLGASAMALTTWFYFALRLSRLAKDLERTVDQGVPIMLRESGVPAERRLARAFNRAAGTFAMAEMQATRDRLTGIPNRESLLRTLAGEVERATRHSKPMSVAFMDIDRFKAINDTYGHRVGDAVLQQLAGLITRSIRASDIFGRYGGEEFMLILPETTPEDAYVLAEELREMVMRRPLSVASGVLVDATISIGVAGGHSTELQVDRLVDAADAAMYVAKSEGRNRSFLFGSVTDESVIRRAVITPERRDAAAAIGRWASASAAQALASVLAPQPHHRGRPSDMIAALSIGVALHMGLSRVELDRIRVAALLHDLGKLALPGEILDKPSSLTDVEWQVVGEHPRIGQVILEQATSMRDAVPIVLHHHERFDGTGYPHGLRGEEIPLGARIVAVADAYHAMVHERPYKSALTHTQALTELRRHASTQFDPTVVEVFIAIFGEQVPSDGLEEIRRLHDHAEGGLEAADPQAAALLHALQPPEEPALPASDSRMSRGGSRARSNTPDPEAPSSGSTLLPAEQTG